MVCRTVSQSVGLSVGHDLSPAKATEPIEMQFGMMSWVVPGNHVLDGGADAPTEGSFLGCLGWPIERHGKAISKALRHGTC